MLKWTYSLIESTIPAGINPAAFAACVRKAMDRTQAAAGGQVTFEEAPQAPSSKLQASPHVNIGFELLSGARQSGSKMTATRPDGAQVHSIAFDTRWKWAVTAWQRAIRGLTGRQCLLTVAMHELGHLLGLEHSDDEWSVMHTPPLQAQFSEFDKMELIYLTRSRHAEA